MVGQVQAVSRLEDVGRELLRFGLHSGGSMEKRPYFCTSCYLQPSLSGTLIKNAT